MIKLRINETFEFEERAGVSFSTARRRMQVKLCQAHRLARQGRKLTEAEEKAFEQDVQGCDNCEPPDIPVRIMAVMAYIVTRRTEPDLTWEAFCEREIDEVWATLGNAGAAKAAGDSSGPSTSNGAGPSSTSFRASRRRATKS